VIEKECEIAAAVAKQVESLRHDKDDPELAHAQEKFIWCDVLEFAALGFDVEQAAQEALKTKEIDFPRWFA